MPQHLMDTISDNNKEMSKILVMAEALEKMGRSMWTDYITSVSHVLKVNEYGGRQAKVNEKRQCFKGGETLVNK